MKTLIETERLLIREYVPEDYYNLFLLNSNPDVMKFINLKFQVTVEGSKKAVENWINYYKANPGLGVWPTILKETNEFIGWTGLIKLENTDEIEVAYRYLPQFWGNRYATEAANALVKYGFQVLNLKRIAAVVNPDNIASAKVIKNLGMKFEKTGEFYDSILDYYSISHDK